MTAAACRPLTRRVPVTEATNTPDRFADLLACFADLRVETARQRLLIAAGGTDDPRVGEVLERVAALERHLADIGAEAASVHQELQHIHLV